MDFPSRFINKLERTNDQMKNKVRNSNLGMKTGPCKIKSHYLTTTDRIRFYSIDGGRRYQKGGVTASSQRGGLTDLAK